MFEIRQLSPHQFTELYSSEDRGSQLGIDPFVIASITLERMNNLPANRQNLRKSLLFQEHVLPLVPKLSSAIRWKTDAAVVRPYHLFALHPEKLTPCHMAGKEWDVDRGLPFATLPICLSSDEGFKKMLHELLQPPMSTY